MPRLERMGWRGELAAALAAAGDPTLSAWRVVSADRRGVRIGDGEIETGAVVPGRMRHRARSRDLPVVGDWVAVRAPAAGEPLVIEAVLPRHGELARRDPDQRSEQVLAANVDLALLVMGLDGDFNLRRLERYVALVRAAGVAPIAVLSKADLCDEAAARASEVEAAFPGMPVLALSLIAPGAEAAVEPHLPPGDTAVLLGSSGAGKFDPAQRALRSTGAAHRRRARARQPRPPHDDDAPAVRPARRRAGHRHARAARARAR